jgi:hypothetical protein
MRQNGSALLMVMMVLMMLGIWLLSDMPKLNSGNSEQDNAAALAEAKDGLIGRSIQEDNRPGSLPCPDTDNDGEAEFFHGNECPSYVGRLPWKTLRLPDLRDAHGERLWYALSRNFRDDDSAEPINSDTRGTLKVYASDGTTDLTPAGSEAVAVIFAPGAALGNQIRDEVAASCAATGTRISRNLCADNYLDFSRGFNNASPIGPFIKGEQSATFNDQIRIIRAKDIMPLVEKRVAKVLREALAGYRSEYGYYPYPAKYDECDASHCDSDATVCRGRIPLNAEAAGTEAFFVSKWFIKNQWYREIYYSVGADSLESSADLDPPCGHTLIVSGEQVDMVFFTPGTPLGSIVRPSDTLSDYLEDSENRDGWRFSANDVYVVPSSTLNDRDRIYTLP